MYKFKIDDREINMPTDWSEITLQRYIDIVKIYNERELYNIPELFVLRLIEVLCGLEQDALDNLNLGELEEIITKVDFLEKEPEWPIKKSLNINGVDYIFAPDINKLTMGEYISIKVYEQNLTGDILMKIPYLLAIILRPAVKELIDGVEVVRQEKFNPDNIEDRKNLFLGFSVYDVMGNVNFFLNGKK